MRQAIRAWVVLLAGWGAIAGSHYLERASGRGFDSITDTETYPKHPRPWREMSFEYRMQYTIDFREEVAWRIKKSAALSVAGAVLAHGGVLALLLWLLCRLDEREAVRREE